MNYNESNAAAKKTNLNGNVLYWLNYCWLILSGTITGLHMTHKTKGIVLRTVKYGETSLVVTILTELFGVQTYMVNGVRTAKKNGGRANYFLPGAILELVVYHHEQKNMQRIREFGWAALYETVLSDVIKNCVALYMMELLYKSQKQPEENNALFYFCEDVLLHLDKADKVVAANIPLYFTLHLCYFSGSKLNDNFSNIDTILDLQEGCFVEERPLHPHFIEGELAEVTAQLLKVMQPEELSAFHLHHEKRRKLLQYYHTYYALHIPDFGEMKTLEVLEDVL